SAPPVRGVRSAAADRCPSPGSAGPRVTVGLDGAARNGQADYSNAVRARAWTARRALGTARTLQGGGWTAVSRSATLLVCAAFRLRPRRECPVSDILCVARRGVRNGRNRNTGPA